MAMTRTRSVAKKDTPPVKEVEPKLLKFRKKPGGGSFRMRNGTIIKPNQVFEAIPEEIPRAFRDQIECLEPTAEEKPLEIKDTEYSIAAADEDNGEKFDVLNSYGKKINEKPLTRGEAETLIAELEE